MIMIIMKYSHDYDMIIRDSVRVNNLVGVAYVRLDIVIMFGMVMMIRWQYGDSAIYCRNFLKVR